MLTKINDCDDDQAEAESDDHGPTRPMVERGHGDERADDDHPCHKRRQRSLRSSPGWSVGPNLIDRHSSTKPSPTMRSLTNEPLGMNLKLAKSLSNCRWSGDTPSRFFSIVKSICAA